MHRIPLSIYRSGTSRGLLFLASDLESVPLSRSGRLKELVARKKDREEETVDYRDLVAARCVGSGHVYGVEGLGGGRSSTSKSIWVRKSACDSLDVELKFVQAEIEKFGVDNSHVRCLLKLFLFSALLHRVSSNARGTHSLSSLSFVYLWNRGTVVICWQGEHMRIFTNKANQTRGWGWGNDSSI